LNERLSHDHPILARVKKNLVITELKDVNYEESNVMMSVSLLFQQANLWHFENHTVEPSVVELK
jgi:hypothetical protein